MNILLVEPNFPYPTKSKNKADQIHKNFVPIGLLKFASLYKKQGDKVVLVRGEKSKEEIGFIPKEILITSIFTYWSSFVWEAVRYYRQLFPKAHIKLGGIYATLHAKNKRFKTSAKKYKISIFEGVHPLAEKCLPDYSLLPTVEYHATHMMRGCIRRCPFCGTWKIEPVRINKSKEEVIKELALVGKNKVIFFDNNILANPHIEEILNALISLRINNKPVSFECQSGFDGRLLEKNPKLATLIKKARFENVRIAWDNGLKDKNSVKRQIDILVEAGYQPKNITIFMIYNFDIPYEDMLIKLNYCKKWGVQISDCRYRPLNIDYDNYKPHMRHGQPEGDYYIHKISGWTDKTVRSFRSLVRRHNIWVRYAKDKGLEYDDKMERWSAINSIYKFFNLGKPPHMARIEKSSRLQEEIKRLNRIKNYYKEKKVQPPDLNDYPKKRYQRFLCQNTNMLVTNNKI